MIARWAAAAGATAAVLVCLATLPQPARAASRPMSACSATSGVVVAVDFGHWGGPVVRACGTTPATGYQLLNQGGFRTTGTSHDGAGFVCRIAYAGWSGGSPRPDSAAESCVRTPPATAYWSYWHADAGASTWSYSRLGAMSSRPRPGSVELWTFGGTDGAGASGSGRPRIGPDAVRAYGSGTAATRTRSGPATTHPANASTDPRSDPRSDPRTDHRPTTEGAGGSAATASGAATTPATTATTPPGTGPATPTGQATSDGAPPNVVLDASPAAATAPTPALGSPVPALIALALVVTLGSGGVLLVQRRTRRAGDDA